jgi:hypothetical protein
VLLLFTWRRTNEVLFCPSGRCGPVRGCALCGSGGCHHHCIRRRPQRWRRPRPLRAFAASGSDLAEGLLASYNGNANYEFSPGVHLWTDGSLVTVYNEPGPSGDAIDHAAYGSVTNDTNATFDLGGWYDLSKVDVYAGWNDSGRDLFSFDLLVSADDTTYATLATFLKGSDNTGQITTPITTLISITDDAGDLASDARYVRLRIFDTDNGAAAIVEFDVFGDGVVPEPTAIVAAGVACFAAAARSSRTRS